MFATVKAGEAIAVIGNWGLVNQNDPDAVTKRIHLHHEERNGKKCNASGSTCLVDPFGWESRGVDPLPNNPDALMWQGYTRPTIHSATLEARHSKLLIAGADLVQGTKATSVELWRELDQVLTGDNGNDGTFRLALVIESKTAGEIVAAIPGEIVQDVMANPRSYVVKIEIEDGPRSKATSIGFR